MTRFEPGDRVMIAAASHPWHGHAGVVARAFNIVGLDWCVRLDDGDYSGHEVGVADRDLEEAPQRG